MAELLFYFSGIALVLSYRNKDIVLERVNRISMAIKISMPRIYSKHFAKEIHELLHNGFTYPSYYYLLSYKTIVHADSKCLSTLSFTNNKCGSDNKCVPN